MARVYAKPRYPWHPDVGKSKFPWDGAGGPDLTAAVQLNSSNIRSNAGDIKANTSNIKLNTANLEGLIRELDSLDSRVETNEDSLSTVSTEFSRMDKSVAENIKDIDDLDYRVTKLELSLPWSFNVSQVSHKAGPITEDLFPRSYLKIAQGCVVSEDSITVSNGSVTQGSNGDYSCLGAIGMYVKGEADIEIKGSGTLQVCSYDGKNSYALSNGKVSYDGPAGWLWIKCGNKGYAYVNQIDVVYS